MADGNKKVKLLDVLLLLAQMLECAERLRELGIDPNFGYEQVISYCRDVMRKVVEQRGCE